MRRIDLKDIVPDLEGRLKKLNTLRKVFMVLALLIIPAIPAMIVLAKYGACMQLCHAVQAVRARCRYSCCSPLRPTSARRRKS